MSDGVGPAQRTGDPKAHLLPNGEAFALCGRPAGPRGRWTRFEHHSPAKDDRCRDCVIAGNALPHRPAVPIYPWRP